MRNKNRLKIFLLVLSLITAFFGLQARVEAAEGGPGSSQEPTPSPLGPALIQPGVLPCDPAAVHALYFYSTDCPHCMAALEETVQPLQFEMGAKLQVTLVEIDYAENYELLIRAEEYFGVSPEDRAIPTLVIGEQVLIGEDNVRTEFREIVEQGLRNGGIPWPAIPDFDPGKIVSAESAGGAEVCSIESGDACETGAPIYAAYFFQTGCDSCSRVEADLAYLRSKYPQLIVEKFNIYDRAAMGVWLAEQAGRKDFSTPAVFMGSQAWIGEAEISPEAIETALQCYQQEGSPKIWEAFDSEQGSQTIAERFRSMSWVTVLLAGLVDGLNPCAFATLIFFVSYLTLAGRKGREVIFVGIAFSLGVFLAYLIVGLGFYKVLDLLGESLNVIAKGVYGLTAVLCIGLAVLSIRDFFKARSGNLNDMALSLPEPLRKRINAVIRKGRGQQAYVIGAFVTGLLISLLELACTGQVYLPTIIFVSSMPELRPRAIFYLVLYNMLFILPLVIVFILAYYGTTSKDLTAFLKKHLGAVKLGFGVLFLALGAWLITSIFS